MNNKDLHDKFTVHKMKRSNIVRLVNEADSTEWYTVEDGDTELVNKPCYARYEFATPSPGIASLTKATNYGVQVITHIMSMFA
jgi:hypothetical protein